MGKLSRLRMLGKDVAERVRGATVGAEERVRVVTVKLYKEHLVKTYPYSEEDKEGVITWETPRKCRMKFKELSVNEGYNKTVKMYKRVHLYKHIYIGVDGEFVVVEF